MPGSARSALKRGLYVGAAGVVRATGIPRLRRLADRPGSLRVLMYHKISDDPGPLAVPVELFERQQHDLRERDRVISLDELVAHVDRGEELPPRSVLLTFDDGYADNVTNAYPILRELGHPAAIFVCTDLMDGGTLPHDRGNPRPSPTASWDQLAQIGDVFEVCSHGRTHRELTDLPWSEARDEIVTSKREIEVRLKTSVRAFAYPRGRCDHNLEAAVSEAGYELGFVVSHGTNQPGFPRLRIRRMNVEPYGISYFRALLGGATEVLAIKDTPPGRAARRILSPRR